MSWRRAALLTGFRAGVSASCGTRTAVLIGTALGIIAGLVGCLVAALN